MGGRRGYGPTHSQSLERFLIGIDNCCTLSLNSLTDVAHQLGPLESVECPAIVLENKVDYTLRTYLPPEGYVVESQAAAFPLVRVRPEHAQATVTVVSFGGMARHIADLMVEIFEETDTVMELLAPTLIHPLDMGAIAESVARTGRIAIFEEGPLFGSVGAELLARLTEAMGGSFRAVRLGGRPVPIPSSPALEDAVLPGFAEICAAITTLSDVS